MKKNYEMKCQSGMHWSVTSPYANLNKNVKLLSLQGEKRRGEPSGPNEIVACTSCAGDGSPCTHTTANNGCATEVILYFNGLFSFSKQKYRKFIIDYGSLGSFGWLDNKRETCQGINT